VISSRSCCSALLRAANDWSSATSGAAASASSIEVMARATFVRDRSMLARGCYALLYFRSHPANRVHAGRRTYAVHVATRRPRAERSCDLCVVLPLGTVRTYAPVSKFITPSSDRSTIASSSALGSSQPRRSSSRSITAGSVNIWMTLFHAIWSSDVTEIAGNPSHVPAWLYTPEHVYVVVPSRIFTCIRRPQ
jgi:hypothetical protein